MRITACGQTMAHLPHWMQVFVSHTGISSARLRFSHLRGAGGISAVGGESAHGKLVAVAGIDGAEDIALKLGRLRGKRGRNLDFAGGCFGNFHLEQMGQSLIDRLQILLNDFFALFAVGVANRLANRLNRLVLGRTFEIAKKQTCMMVFMRDPMPVSRATS